MDGLSFFVSSPFKLLLFFSCSFPNFLNSAAEEEKTEAVLDNVLCISPAFFEFVLVEEGRGQTDEGTSTTENTRCAPTLVSWSVEIIATSN